MKIRLSGLTGRKRQAGSLTDVRAGVRRAGGRAGEGRNLVIERGLAMAVAPGVVGSRRSSARCRPGPIGPHVGRAVQPDSDLPGPAGVGLDSPTYADRAA
jgi:hypothetical protein